MVHGLRIKDNSATYHNHFVRTSIFQQERALGYASFLKFGDLKGAGFIVQMAVQALKIGTGVLSTKVRKPDVRRCLCRTSTRMLRLPR